MSETKNSRRQTLIKIRECFTIKAEVKMKKISRPLAFLFALIFSCVVSVAQGIDGLWGGLTKSTDGSLTYTDGDQWGFYFEDDVCYEAYFLNKEWFYLSEKPVGLVNQEYNNQNKYETSDWRIAFTIKGERLFVEFKPQGSVRLTTFSVKKVSAKNPKEITYTELSKKLEKYFGSKEN